MDVNFTMFRHLKPALCTLALGTVFFGFLYPLSIWGIGQIFFREKAEGSCVYKNGKVIGLQYVGQKFSQDAYFHSRPSYAYKSSDGLIVSNRSNMPLSFTTLKNHIAGRIKLLQKQSSQIKKAVPSDLVTASGSGLDPDISSYAALYQAKRIALIRNIPKEDVEALIYQEEEPDFSGLFPRRVNLLQLNMALDDLCEQ